MTLFEKLVGGSNSGEDRGPLYSLFLREERNAIVAMMPTIGIAISLNSGMGISVGKTFTYFRSLLVAS